MSGIPKEWQTNKNLRYWMSQQPNEEIMSTPDDLFLHESDVVKFAKQFHKEELEKLQEEIAQLKEEIEKLKDVFPRFRATLKSLCVCNDNGVNNLVFCKACKFKESFNQDLILNKSIKKN